MKENNSQNCIFKDTFFYFLFFLNMEFFRKEISAFYELVSLGRTVGQAGDVPDFGLKVICN